MQCPICLENFTRINILSCSHPVCNNCRQRWIYNCPLCRNNSCVLSIENITTEIYKLPKYPSRKDTSYPIKKGEMIILKNIFGDFESTELYNIPIGSQLLCQKFKSNNWWYGTLIDISLHSFQIDNAIYYNRNNGNIYRASPSKRTIKNFTKDQIFLIS